MGKVDVSDVGSKEELKERITEEAMKVREQMLREKEREAREELREREEGNGSID